MTRQVLLAVAASCVVFAVAGCQRVPVGPPAPPGKLVESKEAVHVLTSGTVKADGKLDEAVWADAVAMADFTRGRSDKPEVATRVLVACDKDNLYVAVINDEPNTDKLVTETTERDGAVWDDDCVEIYVDPANTKDGTYRGFFVSASNVVYDRNGGTSWDGEWSSGVTVNKGKNWIVEVAIPFKTLEVTAKSGHELGVMVARNRQAGPTPGRGLYLVPCNNEAKDTELYPVVRIP